MACQPGGLSIECTGRPTSSAAGRLEVIWLETRSAKSGRCVWVAYGFSKSLLWGAIRGVARELASEKGALGVAGAERSADAGKLSTSAAAGVPGAGPLALNEAGC